MHKNICKGNMSASIIPTYWRILVLSISLFTWKHVHGTLYTDSTSRINLARGKPTRQSSTYEQGVSSRAVDGDANPKYDDNSCTQTQKEMNPWWRVDLQQEFVIETIKITNRGDGLGFKLRGMSIYVGNNEAANRNQICVKDKRLFDGETVEFHCKSNPKGRYVYVTISPTKPNTDENTKATIPRIKVKGNLTLCEVQVFELRKINYNVNVAFRKSAKQSSTDGSHKASNALDRSLSTCAKTQTESRPWWRVDLISTFDVASVKVTLCGESVEFDDVQVLAGLLANNNQRVNTRCSTKPGTPIFEYFCPCFPSSRYVFVRLSKRGVLSLKKVEVFVAGRVISDSICDEKVIGGNGDLTNVKIPPRLLYTSTTIDHWDDENTRAYEAFGTQVFMAEIMQGLTQLKHDPTVDNKLYRLRIRADIFYCSKKDQEGEEPHKLEGFQEFEIIAREIISDGCAIHFTQINEENMKNDPFNPKDGIEGFTFGMAGGNGGDGKDGKSGRGLTVIMSYFESMGKMSITANGGDGANGSPGFKGGDGFKGKNGKDAAKKICHSGKGGDAGDGGPGGNGGKGGDGGDGGNGGYFTFLTPGNSEQDIQFVLKGCPGNPGEGNTGGQPGKGASGGIGGKGYKTKIISGSQPVKVRKCRFLSGKNGSDGKNGSNGKRGDNGAHGNAGKAGMYVLKDLEKSYYDDEVAEVILRQADELHWKKQTAEALKLYSFMLTYTKDGKRKEYSKLMANKIEAGLNYYGFKDNYIRDIHISDIDKKVESAMKTAMDEDKKIDKHLYRKYEREQRVTDFRTLTDAMKTMNERTKSETDGKINIWRRQRTGVVSRISSIEFTMSEIIKNLWVKIDAVNKRLQFDSLIKFLRICVTFAKPERPAVEDIFETILETGQEAADCGDKYNYQTMTTLMETAIQFSEFEGKTYDWNNLDLSNLKPQAAAEMSKVLMKDKIAALEETFNCLFKHGKQGLELSGAIGTYLDYALTRFTLISEVYRIDIKLAEYKIRLQTIQEKNRHLYVLSRNYEAHTAEVILNKVAITEDLIQTFEETTKDVLAALYFQAESLRFVTLWDFEACMSFYVPNHLIRADKKSYFDGYRPLASLYKKIEGYRENLRETRMNMNSGETQLQYWIVEFKDENSKPIERLRHNKTAQIKIDESFFRTRGHSNFRLHRLYAEFIFRADKMPKLRHIFINIDHMGDNHFHVRSSGEEQKITMLLDVHGENIASQVENPILKGCTHGNACLGKLSYPEVPHDICDVSRVRKQTKRSTIRSMKVPCRSPWATYQVRVPIGLENRQKTGTNPSSTDISGIIGLRILIGISYWENYPASQPECPKGTAVHKVVGKEK